MSEKKMKQKELKRQNIMDSISRIEMFVTNYNEDRDLQEVAIRLGKLDTLMENFEAIQEFNVSRKVDLIIGAEYFFTMLKGGRINLGTSFPILAESVFDWVVSGKTDFETQNVTCCVSTLESIDRNLERFWKVDELDWSNITPSEQYCEDFYTKTVSRESCGRYMVKYPKKEQFSAMVGNSHLHAVRRLQSLERKLDKDEVLKKNYHDFLAEFLELGHMRELAGDAVDPPNVFYLPHHAVLKDSSTTTKVRSVFDGSAKTGTGYSLNDALLIGPVIQDDPLSLVIRFRKYKVALLADIEKMYRQVSIHPDDRPLQRVLWRFSQDEPIAKYELTTVTYELAPSSFLATRTLKQLADDEGAKNELHALYKMLTNHTEIDRIATSFAKEGITWHMIPPRAPNFGGLWEAAVKVAKRC
ncbi:uncharacterized protein LOC131679910 [Topomyia yanbarensis]|uniref:uncharacterized protein LOC131679910 n=1 Tax=Topomyia yanbarensis TaxID=2498891 RepID=UPI00273BB63F|nr:uncharacterized protein LOC131679910 [Topomyia yanbarensis]